jgi:hypothetical protein
MAELDAQEGKAGLWQSPLRALLVESPFVRLVFVTGVGLIILSVWKLPSYITLDERRSNWILGIGVSLVLVAVLGWMVELAYERYAKRSTSVLCKSDTLGTRAETESVHMQLVDVKMAHASLLEQKNTLEAELARARKVLTERAPICERYKAESLTTGQKQVYGVVLGAQTGILQSQIEEQLPSWHKVELYYRLECLVLMKLIDKTKVAEERNGHPVYSYWPVLERVDVS